MLDKISVILPIAPDSDDWKDMVNDLRVLPAGAEILFLCAQKNDTLRKHPNLKKLQARTRFVIAPKNKVKCLNAGAKAASNEYLWFLSPELRLSQDAFEHFKKTFKRMPHVIYYFNLRFKADGSPFIFVNEFLHFIRSRFFGLPNLLQGLCMPKHTFTMLDHFDDKAGDNFDLEFLNKAREQMVRTVAVDADILTSAKNYRQKGWWRETLRYQKPWIYKVTPKKVFLFIDRVTDFYKTVWETLRRLFDNSSKSPQGS